MRLPAAAVVPPIVSRESFASSTPLVSYAAWVPVTSVPMKLPSSRSLVAVGAACWERMPTTLPEMTLPAPGAVPPIVILPTESSSSPVLLPARSLPVTSVPMKLPAIVSPPLPVKSIPILQPSMTRPETVLLPALMVRPFKSTGPPCP